MSSGIFLENRQVERANALHSILRNLSGKSDWNVTACTICNGTGLLGVTDFGNGNKHWDGKFCALCKGVGFEQVCYKDTIFVCNKCNGTGHSSYGERKCLKCEGQGIVDWVTRATGI